MYLIVYHLALIVMRMAGLTESGDDRGIGVRFPAGAREFSLLHNTQTGSEAHPASYTMDNDGSFPGVKAARGVKLTTHFHQVPRLRMVELYFYSLIHLHGVVLN
jgi:hypothetical protein